MVYVLTSENEHRCPKIIGVYDNEQAAQEAGQEYATEIDYFQAILWRDGRRAKLLYSFLVITEFPLKGAYGG